MAATQSSGVSFDDFNALIEGAVNRRAACVYQHLRAFHFHWANDNAFPDHDQRSFSEICNILGFPAVDSHILDTSDPMPGNTIREKLTAAARAAIQQPGRTLLAVHYAGRGCDNGTGQLVISDQLGKKLARADLLIAPFDVTELSPSAPIDVLYIFDCCFGYLATRDITPRSRMVEIISGNDERDPIAFGAKKAHSFTSKLLVEVRSRAQRGEKEIEIANLIESLPSATKQPTHAVKAGMGSIVVPVPSPPTTPAQQSQPGPGLLSTFTIHTAPSFDGEEVKKIIDWIHSFPNTRRMSLRFEGSKWVNSTLFFFEARKLAYMRIAGAPGVTLICHNKPVRAARAAAVAHSPTRHAWVANVNDENMPPAGGSSARRSGHSK